MTLFINKGEIHPDTWRVFGLSAKNTENPIGMFGTGLKYAIAVLLREGREITIWSGNERYEFTTQNSTFRDKEFSRVYCNGELIPFTTEFGKNWEIWMAYREIASNCFDEGGRITDDNDNVRPGANKTIIKVGFDDVVHDDIFLNTRKRPIVSESAECTVYVGESPYIYNNGVRAYKLPHTSKFTYNYRNLAMTEERNIASWWSIESLAAKTLMKCTDDRFIGSIVFPEKNTFEAGISYDHYFFEPSELVIDYITMHRTKKSCNGSIIRAMSGYMPKLEYAEINVPKILLDDYTRAVVLLKAIGFENIERYPVSFRVLPDGVLGMADRDKQEIYLTERCLNQGIKQIAATLLEEYIHIAEGYDDCTYNMQTYLFDLIITVGQEKLSNVK